MNPSAIVARHYASAFDEGVRGRGLRADRVPPRGEGSRGPGPPRGSRGRAQRGARRASGERTRKRRAPGAWTLYGLGPAPVPHGRLRAVVRRALKEAARKSRRIAVVFDDGVSADGAVRAAAADRDRGLRLRPVQEPRPKDAPRAARRGRHRDAARTSSRPPSPAPPRGRTPIADAVVWARDLGNTPGNDLGPGELAREAGALAKRHGLRFRVLDKRAIERERMGGLLGVNAGSARPPVFLIGEYAPKRGPRDGGPRGQGHHLRLGRHLAQARRLDGRDEVRHDGRGDRLRLSGRGRGARASGSGRGAGSRDREHAGRVRDAAGRHPADAQRQDRRGRQHRRRGPPDPGRCAFVRRELRARRADRLRDPDRRGPDRARAPSAPA